MANQDAAPIVNLVQNDTGREIEYTILDFDIPAGATSKLWLIKPSNKISSCDGVISGNVVTVALTDQVVAENGMCVAQLKITKNGKTLSSFTMHFNFEEDASTNGIISQEEIKLVETFITEQKKKLDAYIAEKTQDIEKLKTDVGTLSNDLTTLRNDHNTDIESLEQNSTPPIILTATGESITLEDSAERRVQGLRIFGKSEQNGVPSPDDPIPIVNIGENGEIKIFVHSTQLFDASKLPTKSAGGATVTNNGDGSFTISGSGTLTNRIQISYRIEHEDFVKLFHAGNVKVTWAMNEGFYFEIQVLSSSVGNLYIRHGTTADITKQIEAPDSYCAVMLIGNSGVNIPNITIKPMIYQDGDGTWEPYKPLQSLSLQTPNGLPGIPISSGGNYTDANGQQWICDEIDLKRGKYVKRVDKIEANGTTIKFVASGGFWNLPQGSAKGIIYDKILSNISTRFAANLTYKFIFCGEKTLAEYFTTIDEFNNYCLRKYNEGNPVVFYYAISSIERDLTPEEIQEYKALHTNYQTTVIFNDENAGMEVSYIADTKNYIDKKFKELNQAIVNTQIALL